MPYCTASDVRLIIETSLTDTEIETLIEMSDAEIDTRIGTQSPTDKLVKKLSALTTAHTIKTRQPQTTTIGEYREDTGNTLETWANEINRIIRLKQTPTIKSTEYTHINQQKRNPQ